MSLSLQDRVAALAGAAAALAGRSEFKSALAGYSEAVQLASTGLPPGSSAVRSLAVGGNTWLWRSNRKKIVTLPKL